MLELLAEFLQTRGLGTVGVSIFVDFMPAQASGILLRSNPGGEVIDHELPGMLMANFMLIARNDGYEETRLAAQRAIYELQLGAKHRLQLSTFEFRSILGRTKPFTFPPAQGSQREFAANLDVVYIERI